MLCCLWFSSRLLLSSLSDCQHCNEFQLLICSWANVVLSVHFLQTSCHLLNVYDSVPSFVCRLFTKSREVSIIDKASFIRRWSHQGQLGMSFFFYDNASLPCFLRYVERFKVRHLCAMIFNCLIFHETRLRHLFNFLKLHFVQSLITWHLNDCSTL